MQRPLWNAALAGLPGGATGEGRGGNGEGQGGAGAGLIEDSDDEGSSTNAVFVVTG